MKSLHETLQQKEQEFKRLEVEIGILRAAQSILKDAEQAKAAAAAGETPPAESAPASNPVRVGDWVISSLPSSAPGYSASSAAETRADSAPVEAPRRSFP